MKVVRATRPQARDGSVVDLFEMIGGKRYRVNKHGWILDGEGNPVLHPEVDEVMVAILAWEKSLAG